MSWQKIAAALAVTVAAIAIAMAIAIPFNPDTIIEMLYRLTLDQIESLVEGKIIIADD